MWDVAILQALAYPELCEEKEIMTPHDNLARNIKVYTKIDVPAMKANFGTALGNFLAK